MTGSCGASRIASRVVEITRSSAASRDRYATGLPSPAPLVSCCGEERGRLLVERLGALLRRARLVDRREARVGVRRPMAGLDGASTRRRRWSRARCRERRAPADSCGRRIAPPATQQEPAAAAASAMRQRAASSYAGSRVRGRSDAVGASAAAIASQRVSGMPIAPRSACAIATSARYAARSRAHVVARGEMRGLRRASAARRPARRVVQ